MNDLAPKEWIRFQKSWFVHDPPPRRKDVKLHPAKFPETLAQEFIEFFTKADQTVLDPMVGTGSTLIACLRSGRHGIGIELSPKYAELATRLVEEEQVSTAPEPPRATVIQGDAADLLSFDLPPIDYVFTSPPYWNMLHARGAGTQKQRREDADLDVTYSDEPAD
ncbi:MAG: methyltransferase domain-containing protein, partial [Chloroflexi bacterium]|nr:methyltransferase domain-containing protein [Chloroflexota bacterium]